MDVSANILVQAVGGSSAAAEINKATNALANVSNASAGLEERFQHKFQHIGLMLFAGEALRASGLGAETRQVIGLLNMSLMAMSSSMGAMAAPVMLSVAALAAFSGAVQKIAEHTKSAYEELQKVADAHRKEHDETLKVTDSISAYIQETGKVPGYLRAWQVSEQALSDIQLHRMEVTERLELDAGVRMLNVSRQKQEALRDEVSDQERLVDSLKKQAVSQEVLIAQAAELKVLQQKYDDQTYSVAKQKAEVDKLIASLRLLRTEGTDDLDRLTKAHEKARKSAEDAEKKQHKSNQEILKDLNEQAMASYEAWEAEKKANEQMYKQFEESAKNSFNSVNNAQAQAFAKSIVEGKSFGKEMAHIWKDLAEQVIAQIEAMIVKLTLLWALEQATGMGHAAAIASPAGKILGFASGGSMMVNRPTLFMAGESGPETVNVRPLSKMGGTSGAAAGSGGKGDVYYIQPHIHGITDPDALADVIGRKLVTRIRGRGDINFGRNG